MEKEKKRERECVREREWEKARKNMFFVIKTCRNRIFKMQAPHSKINRQPLRMVRLPLPDARFKSHTSPLYHFFTFLYHSLTKQTCKNQWCYPNHYEPKRTPIRCRKEMKKAEKSGKRYHLWLPGAVPSSFSRQWDLELDSERLLVLVAVLIV